MSIKTLKILCEPEVENLTGLSTTTRWRLEKNGSFPRKVRLSANRVGWYEHEVKEWLNTRMKAEG